jgi:hypothetical protein
VRHSLRVAAVLAACASALALAAGASARQQIVIVNSYSGHYEGFFDSSVTGQIAEFTMDIAPSRTPVYSGLMLSDGIREPFHVAIGRDGGFIALGTGASGFLAVGRATPLAGGASSLSTAGYLLRTPFGLDHGSLRFVQSLTGGDASQLPQDSTGTCTLPDGSAVSIDFRMAGAFPPGPPTFGASIAIGGFAAPIVGSVGSADLRTGSAPLVATGVSAAGSIDFDGSWVSGGQPHMQGTATVTLADGSVSVDDCALVPAVRTTAGQ